jgi:hypothetical protein
MSPVEGLLHQIANKTRIYANCVIPGWAYSVTLARRFVANEMPQIEQVCGYPSRATETGELVRIDLTLLDDVASLPLLKLDLRMELEPFIIGVGKSAPGRRLKAS